MYIIILYANANSDNFHSYSPNSFTLSKSIGKTIHFDGIGDGRFIWFVLNRGNSLSVFSSGKMIALSLISLYV